MTTPTITTRIKLRGAALEVIKCRDGQVLIAGPAGTGKSFAALWKVHLMCLKNPGMRALMCRKTHKSLTSTGLVTFKEKVARDAIAAGLLKYFGGSGQTPAQWEYSNGSVIVVGGLDQPDKIMSSEYDCLVGETLVDSPSAIQGAYGRSYSGKLVTITTASGKKLTGTPNHPVLTTQGWAGLGSVHEGDHVVRRAVIQPEVVTGARPDVADQPATIAEVTRTLTFANPGGTKRVETVSMDFHGDGADGYVDVVPAAGFFHRRRGSAGAEHLIELGSKRRNLQQGALMGQRARIELAAAGLPSMVTGSLLLAESGHAFSILGGVAPGFAVGVSSGMELAEPIAVGVSDMAQRLSFGARPGAYSASGHLLLESPGADVDRFGSFAQPEFPFEVTADRVVEIVVADAGPGGHVYNLQTADSWYVANEIISHNCIFVQEATEATPDDIEKLDTRLRNGVTQLQQLIMDCNPQQPAHPLKKRCDDGRTTMLISRHTDNPRLYDEVRQAGAQAPTYEMTEYGRNYLERLQRLTGVRKERLYHGRWAAAEGIIYDEWDALLHVSDRKKLPREWRRIWAVDFGFRHPFVWQQWAIDDDGALWLELEIHRTERIVEDHARDILNAVMVKSGPNVGQWKYGRPEAIVCDHDAEDRATLERHLGMGTQPAWKGVSDGIEAVKARLRPRANGRPGLYVLRDSLVERDATLAESGRPNGFLEEVEGYVWKPSPDGKPIKDEPLKEGDDSMDCGRYAAAYCDLAPRPRLRWVS